MVDSGNRGEDAGSGVAEKSVSGMAIVSGWPWFGAPRLDRAWNKYDEGGWLAPTRSTGGAPNTSRLDAVRKVLTKQHAQPNDAGKG